MDFLSFLRSRPPVEEAKEDEDDEDNDEESLGFDEADDEDQFCTVDISAIVSVEEVEGGATKGDRIFTSASNAFFFHFRRSGPVKPPHAWVTRCVVFANELSGTAATGLVPPSGTAAAVVLRCSSANNINPGSSHCPLSHASGRKFSSDSKNFPSPCFSAVLCSLLTLAPNSSVSNTRGMNR